MADAFPSDLSAEPVALQDENESTTTQAAQVVTAFPLNNRIDSLQSIRLFASLGVLQYHLWANYLNVQIGHPGTDFFLVVVGMVAALSQSRRISEGRWGKYMLARTTRLYVTYVPLFLLALVAKWGEATWDWGLRSFFLLPIPDRSPVIGATWMLSNFLLFYLVFSVAFLARREIILVPVFLVWATAIAAYTWFNWLPNIPNDWSALIFAERNLEMIFGYGAGVIFRKNLISVHRGRGLVWIGLAGIIGGTVLLNIGYSNIDRSLYLGIPIALFVLGISALEKSKVSDGITRFLTWPKLVWLGGTSYVLYLSHGIFLQAWSRFLPTTPPLVPFITISAMAVAAAGTILWEKPILIRAKAWLKLG